MVGEPVVGLHIHYKKITTALIRSRDKAQLRSFTHKRVSFGANVR